MFLTVFTVMYCNILYELYSIVVKKITPPEQQY